jgi:hypothetical protein
VSPYSRASKICKAAIHYGALPLSTVNIPMGASQAATNTLCAAGLVPVVSPHTTAMVGNRAHGRPQLTLTLTTSQSMLPHLDNPTT